MDVAALIVWIITALGGFVLLGTWIRHGGVQQQKSGGSRLPAPIVFSHFLLAAAGLVIWIVYVITDTDALAWTAVVLLVLIALLGFTMFARWLPVQRGTATVGTEAPAEKHFPVPVVAAHGIVAVTTLVLAVLAAAGVGGS